MDIIAITLAKKAGAKADELEKVVEGIADGIKYKGAVDYYADLEAISTKKIGDCYTVKYKGSSGTEECGDEYVWGKYEGTNQ